MSTEAELAQALFNDEDPNMTVGEFRQKYTRRDKEKPDEHPGFWILYNGWSARGTEPWPVPVKALEEVRELVIQLKDEIKSLHETDKLTAQIIATNIDLRRQNEELKKKLDKALNELDPKWTPSRWDGVK